MLYTFMKLDTMKKWLQESRVCRKNKKKKITIECKYLILYFFCNTFRIINFDEDVCTVQLLDNDDK